MFPNFGGSGGRKLVKVGPGIRMNGCIECFLSFSFFSGQ